MDHITNIWSEVSNWPPEQRLALAARLLQSLQRDDAPAAFSQRQEALRQLIGIWKTAQPPNDAQVEQMIEQERIKKYG